MKIFPANPSFEEIAALRERYQLMEDWRRNCPEKARLLHDLTLYYEIVKGREIIGYLWFEAYDQEMPELGCIMGICVEREHWGRWSAEAMPELLATLEIVFEQLGVPRIGVEFDRRRVYVEKFFAKLGFVYEGRRRNGLVINGRRRDQSLLGLTEGKFKEFRDAVVDSSRS